MLDAERFERLLRDQLARRDRKRSERRYQPDAAAEADETLVDEVMRAAGYDAPHHGGRRLRKARRREQQNWDAAFGDDEE